MKKWLAILALLSLAACGGTPPPARRAGPDVVTAEWTSGDDAPLDAGTSTTTR